jgi:hypothetical protein
VLIPLLAWIVCSIVTQLISGLSLPIGDLLQTINTFLLSAVLTILGCVAIYGGGMVYIGKGFLYPVIGRRVLEGTIRKQSEE